MGEANVERRLAAIMFTDIVGYTALMARDEEAARDRNESPRTVRLDRGQAKRSQERAAAN